MLTVITTNSRCMFNSTIEGYWSKKHPIIRSTPRWTNVRSNNHTEGWTPILLSDAYVRLRVIKCFEVVHEGSCSPFFPYMVIVFLMYL